jgi:tetratricopeptide (TPR) repeat protein
MFIHNHYIDDLSSEAQAQVEAVLRRFEEAWLRGERPAINDYLPADPCRRRAVLLELAHTDLEYRLKAGDVIGVETYLQAYPELSADRAAVLDLMAAEKELRCLEQSGPPSTQDSAQLAPGGVWRGPMPRQLGRYELLQPLGSGSFGIVFQAHDTELDRLVAIKLSPLGNRAVPDQVDRFLREVRSTAQLRHPGIVPVYDAGQEKGWCYLVSEFIPGETLARRLKAGRPAFTRTAEVVACIAEALEAAHRQGIVHRDIKPSNILLDPDGRPLLTDFGLAKWSAEEPTLTVKGQILGTPAYMSPEQARGEAYRVDARSDVYSLGAVLYELLTGELPFRGDPRQVLRQVREEEPRPPRRWNDRIPRDLETICLKAMTKEPGGRYATAAALAADLRRFLHGQPVQARPVGWVGRFARWCRRQPAAAALIAALLVGLAGTTWQWRRAEINRAAASREHARAEQNFQEAWRAVTEFAQIGLSQPSGASPELSPLKEALAEKALAYYQDFLEREEVVPERMADVARIYLEIARFYTYILPGKRDQMLDAWRKDRPLWESLARRHPEVVEYQMGQTECAYHLAHFAATPEQGAEALQTLEQTCAFLTRLPPEKWNNSLIQFDLYQAYQWMGLLQRDAGRPAEALKCHQQALAAAKQMARGNPANLSCRAALARSSYHVARAQAEAAHPAEAIRAYQDSAAVWDRLAADFPMVAGYRRDLAACYHNLGNLYRDMGRPAEAVDFYQKALPLREELSRQYPHDPGFRSDWEGTRRNLAQSFTRPRSMSKDNPG